MKSIFNRVRADNIPRLSIPGADINAQEAVSNDILAVLSPLVEELKGNKVSEVIIYDEEPPDEGGIILRSAFVAKLKIEVMDYKPLSLRNTTRTKIRGAQRQLAVSDMKSDKSVTMYLRPNSPPDIYLNVEQCEKTHAFRNLGQESASEVMAAAGRIIDAVCESFPDPEWADDFDLTYEIERDLQGPDI